MYCSVISTALCGVEAVPVFVEADCTEGMPSFCIVGNVSSQVREGLDRVRAALKNYGISIPPRKLTLNLSPAENRKEGTRFDLPIAASILAILSKIPEVSLDDTMIIGELSLAGRVLGVSGVLPSVIKAKEQKVRMCIVPMENLHEARQVKGINVIGIRDLGEFLEYCIDGVLPPEEEGEKFLPSAQVPDFSDIKGQDEVKRAALISAAGFHNLLLTGPPGSGKSMTARRIPGILPEMTEKEQQDVSVIYSVAGLLNEELPYITQRPFRSPHNSLSPQALCGGGRIPKPGEITLAHRGVLFIDELPYMPQRNLEYLRGPLEDRKILISRAYGSYEFPADFLFVAAMNPCPCGYYPDMKKCRCTENNVRNYIARISQPILDRIEVRVNVPPAKFDVLLDPGKSRKSQSMQMKETVANAFEIQKKRYADLGICFNSELDASRIQEFCRLSGNAQKLLKEAFLKMDLSARGYHRVLKLARTIADLEEAEIITDDHVGEALRYRGI